MDFNSLQVIVIKDTYEIYDKLPEVQSILAPVWGMKLKGYKNFYNDSSICPNDKLDFYSNHIIVTRKNDLSKPLAAIKTISYENCKVTKCDFPIMQHLFGDNIIIENYLQAYALNEWIELHKESGIAYSNGFSMDPNLPKNIRRFLLELITYTFESFYIENNIPNIVHGVNTASKIDKKFETVGFKDLSLGGRFKIPTFKMESLLDLDVRIMTSENYGINCKNFSSYEQLRGIWDEKIELSLMSLNELKIAA